MRGRLRPLAASERGLLGAASSVEAHGFGQRYDLPVPLWMWLAPAASRQLRARPFAAGLFAAWMAAAGGAVTSRVAVACAFVVSLVPIAIGYHLAHSFGHLLIQGQLAVPLASDPFGFGWNLLGTAGYRPDIGIVGARFAWYTAVLAIVGGHVVAVYVAHAIALRRFPRPAAALRSQVPMLVLMMGYTMVSLWIIAQPIVEIAPRGQR